MQLILACPNWFEQAGGKLQLSVVADPPYLDGPSFTEQAINFFVGNWLTPFIDGKIKSNLPGAIRKTLPLDQLQNQCNCLDVVVDGAPPQYKNSAIQYQLVPTIKPGPISLFNSINVSVDSIRRLKASNFETGEVLYRNIEDFGVDFYANRKVTSFQLKQMAENEARKLPTTTLSVPNPGKDGTLILIATLRYSNGRSDSEYWVFDAKNNFGNGVKKLIVRKYFFTNPESCQTDKQPSHKKFSKMRMN